MLVVALYFTGLHGETVKRGLSIVQRRDILRRQPYRERVPVVSVVCFLVWFGWEDLVGDQVRPEEHHVSCWGDVDDGGGGEVEPELATVFWGVGGVQV